ncbi:efflux RND transporter permease subunit [bacterium]|nr:efflux RND transporter permease subunit [bacterium]
MNKFIEFFVRKSLFGNILMIALVAMGIWKAVNLRLEAFPNVTFDVITIDTIFPGASPEEVERLITNKVEQELKEVDGIKELTSKSIESRSSVVIKLDPDQTTEQQAKQDIQDVIDRITTLPDDAEDPVVTSIQTKQTPVIEVTMSGDLNELDLRAQARLVEKRLELLPGVARVVGKGLRDREIHVEASSEKMARTGISLDDMIKTLQGQNVSIPGGKLDANPSDKSPREYIIRTIGEFKNASDVESAVVRANDLGRAVRIQDIATVRETLADEDVLYRSFMEPSINLTVMKLQKADVIEVVKSVRAEMEKVKPQLDKKVRVGFINDVSIFVERRLSVLTNNLMVGLILVLIILSLILPFRVSALVALAIPLSFLASMIFFDMFDVSINLLSMIGLIIASGMLVDNAIVVTDNSVRLMEEGENPTEAAIKGAQQIWVAVLGSAATTICVFIPLMVMSGIMGKFVRQIPIGVIIPVAISLVASFFILPSQIATWIRVKEKKTQSESKQAKMNFLEKTAAFWDAKMVPAYGRIISTVLDRRYLVSFCMFLAFIGCLLLARFGMKFVLFPPGSVEQFFIRAEAPVGTSLEKLGTLMQPLEKAVADLNEGELDNFVTYLGLQMRDPNDPSTRRGSNFGQLHVFLTPDDDRERTASEILEAVREAAGNPPGLESVTFELMIPGPPVGRAVDLGVQGETYERINEGVRVLQEEFAKIDGVTDIDNSFIEGKDEIRVIVRDSEAAAAGLSTASVGTSVRAAFEGLEASTITGLDEEIAIIVTLPTKDKDKRSTLENLKINNAFNNLVPLSRVADFKDEKGLSIYEHQDNRRQVRVFANVLEDKITSSEANSIIAKEILPKVQEQFKDLHFAFGGENKDTQESMQSLADAFVVAIVGILLILIFLFGNLLYSLLIMLSVPLGVMAVIVAFFVNNMPMSFMGMFGVVALAGVIVNNAIVFIDFVNQKRIEGEGDRESIESAAKMRLRPIFLTTLTTVAGLFPTAYGIGGLEKFVQPIAMALAWGLIVGSVLTSIFLPASIAISDDIRKGFEKLMNRFRKSEVS